MDVSARQRLTLGLIWAQANGRIIGAGGDIPWHVPEDMAHFKAITSGHPVIMGRRTWESIPSRFRPLPERTNIVVTRQRDWHADGAVVAVDVPDALSAAARIPAATDAIAWVMGGGQLYASAIASADTLEVTELDLDIAGDTYAPEIGPEWEAPAGEWLTSRAGVRYRFRRYTRRLDDAVTQTA